MSILSTSPTWMQVPHGGVLSANQLNVPNTGYANDIIHGFNVATGIIDFTSVAFSEGNGTALTGNYVTENSGPLAGVYTTLSALVNAADLSFALSNHIAYAFGVVSEGGTGGPDDGFLLYNRQPRNSTATATFLVQRPRSSNWLV